MIRPIKPQPHGRVWDPLVRLTHWTIALAIILNGSVIGENAQAHIWIGYIALGFLALRLFWGVIGPKNARFSSFPVSLSAAMRHISRLRRAWHPKYRSHNPLGALMVYALWGILVVVSLTGIALQNAPIPENEDRYSAEINHESETFIEELHKAAASFLLLLAALHVGSVVLKSRLSGQNLVRPMISGRRS